MNENFIKNTGTYDQINYAIGKMDPLPPDLKHLKGVKKIYKLVFTIQLFENNGVLQKASLPSQTTAQTENYLGIKGHSEMLYLVRFTDTTKSDVNASDAYIFYSLKFDASGKCIAYKPIQIGSSRKEFKDNTRKDTIEVISLMYEIKVSPDEKTKKKQTFTRAQKKKLFYKPAHNTYEMKVDGVEELKQPLLFVINSKTDNAIEVGKILAQYPNKIGGKDFLLFDLKEIMPDHQALKFNSLK